MQSKKVCIRNKLEKLNMKVRIFKDKEDVEITLTNDNMLISQE